MCYKVSAEIVIANYFAECNNVDELKFSTLVNIKNQIEENFQQRGKYLFVDISRSSILGAINSNPKYFSFDYSNASIKFNNSQRENLYEDVYGIFNAKLNLKIKFVFLEVLENLLEVNAVNQVLAS